MIDVLGWIAAAVVLVSLNQRDAKRLHRLNIVACLMFLVYDVALSLPAMVAMNSVLLGVSVRQISRLRSTSDEDRPHKHDSPSRSTAGALSDG